MRTPIDVVHLKTVGSLRHVGGGEPIVFEPFHGAAARPQKNEYDAGQEACVRHVGLFKDRVHLLK